MHAHIHVMSRSTVVILCTQDILDGPDIERLVSVSHYKQFYVFDLILDFWFDHF